MTKRPWQKLYGTAKWYRLRHKQLQSEPLCWMCQSQGHVTPATVVDHHKPHKGDTVLFHDPANLRSLCSTHHDSTKQRAEKSGKMPGCDESGWPIDRGHHWYGGAE